MSDTHALLGLPAGASAQQIKRAFRKLAMRWHPDRNPDPAAADQFRRLRDAHDRLLAALLEGKVKAHEDAAATQPPPQRGADRWQTLEISIEECFTGARRTVEVERRSPCVLCGGSGIEKLSVSRLCTPCRGSGRLHGPAGLERCPDCEGRGYRNTGPCGGCGGSGEQMQTRHLEVLIPPGVVDDDELRLAGEGEAHPEPRHRAGDLHLQIRLASHPLFRREGRDLVLRRPVSALRLLIGGTLRVPHPTGVRSIELEPGLAHPRSLRVPGAGFPAHGRRARGDLVVEFEPELPHAPERSLHGLIDELDRALAARAEHHFPELARWESVWLDEH
ncbi:MAG TPA: DnaJ C-terminal domain-containing protein [Thauera aminoaromatica]|nr:DnaJ C-terminal domain-containing protein [Thauera aminoaromatica]HNE99996.1 DnaJ C-terminal domain-containing protein [Thauera aminoaromatica]